MVCLIDVVSGKAVAMTARAVSCDGCLCSVCHYCDQLVSRDPWQMQHGLCSVSGFQTNSVAVTRSLSNVDTLSLQMHFCYLFLKNNAEATVYCTLQIESSVLSFYFCLFPFHLKCSLVGQRNSIAREVLKRSFFYMVFFILWTVLETVTRVGWELQAVQCLPTCSLLYMRITCREAPCSAWCRQFSLRCLQQVG